MSIIPYPFNPQCGTRVRPLWTMHRWQTCCDKIEELVKTREYDSRATVEQGIATTCKNDRFRLEECGVSVSLVTSSSHITILDDLLIINNSIITAAVFFVVVVAQARYVLHAAEYITWGHGRAHNLTLYSSIHHSIVSRRYSTRYVSALCSSNQAAYRNIASRTLNLTEFTLASSPNSLVPLTVR
jgi:hypothetical protein